MSRQMSKQMAERAMLQQETACHDKGNRKKHKFCRDKVSSVATRNKRAIQEKYCNRVVNVET